MILSTSLFSPRVVVYNFHPDVKKKKKGVRRVSLYFTSKQVGVNSISMQNQQTVLFFLSLFSLFLFFLS